MRLGESAILRRAASVVVLSEFMRTEASVLGASPQNMTVLPGGIDVKRFSPGISSAPVVHGGGPLLFTARRMVPRTGVVELVNAFAEILQAIPGARLVLAGGGPLEESIRTRVQALGIEEQVQMVGWVSDSDLVNWYRAADLVIMPTQELEGFGLTSAEAMACGTPVVGTPVGANPEVLKRLDECLVTRDSSSSSIAETVTKLLLDPDRLRELASRARAAVDPAFSWSSIAASYLEIYERGGAGPRIARDTYKCGAPKRAAARSQMPSVWSEVLRSPVSGEPLIPGDGSLRTADAREVYPVIDGIPVLLPAGGVFSADAYEHARRPTSGLAARFAPLLRRALPSLSHNLSATRNLSRLRDLLRETHPDRPSRVLVVGGAILGEGMEALVEDPAILLVGADVAVGPRTDVICDAHALPFAEDVFDGVVCQAVLEHVADPARVVSEIHRVLKPAAFVYSEIPFMQQVHEGAYDFTRFTYNGHRRLFRWFEQIDAGATAGPGMALGWSVRALLTALVGERSSAQGAVNLFATLTLFWLKYFDRLLLGGRASALDGASGIYFLGQAQGTPRSDEEIIAGYRGINDGFSIRR